MTETTTHERIHQREHAAAGSDRAFGMVFVAVFAAVGFWPMLHDGPPRIWALTLSVVTLLIAVLAPRLLTPLNRAWLKFGLILSKIVNPVVLGIMFFIVITPMGLIMRAFGGDPLRTRFDESADSYWIVRDPPGPSGDTMRNQF